MLRSYKTQAIILSRRNFGEADKLITIFTKEFGKKKILAKGIRRIHSRRAPYLELFSQSEIILHKGKTFDLVTEVTSINSFSFLRKRLERIGFVYVALELTDRLTAEGQESPEIFAALLFFIHNLNHTQTLRSTAQSLLFEFKRFILGELGFIEKSVSASEEFLDQKIESVIENTLKSPALLTNIQLAL